MSIPRNWVIGVDFDNTLVTYDALLKQVAIERGLLTPGVNYTKKEVRDHVRHLPNGEIEWQKLQAVVYGTRIGEAQLIEGVDTFFRQCRRADWQLYIVSHKTEFAGYDETGTSLRQAALDWMWAHRFFASDGLGLTPATVVFGATRQEKLDAIRQLGCTHFIDDLEETFLESGFPQDVEKILFAPHPPAEVPPGVRVITSWQGIGEYFFGISD